ncbi:MAG TPA: winged helix-turn-helix domain-containing protein [Steroidobacteraceae bacterium]|nr:winged helix-turn-helix domain-containing protein [Steroidobacteraceae bacterium]
MSDGPNIARIAALIGDPARAEMLTALMADRALTATELAGIAGVTKQTVSAHLARMREAKLVTVAAQGRHRYFRLADRDVARLLESLMGVAFRTGSVRLRSSPREPALRRARVCYDHLAGELAVWAYEALVARRVFRADADGFELTRAGAAWFTDFGIDVSQMRMQRRSLCRPCLDWGERRHHLGGALGAALLQRFYALRWGKAQNGSRVVNFTPSGEAELRRRFTP